MKKRRKEFTFELRTREQLIEEDFFDCLRRNFEQDDLTEFDIQIVGVCPYIDNPSTYAIFYTYLN